MQTESLNLVLLRQPMTHRPNERRSDPFWEFGSFGRTGCHSHNLLGARSAPTLVGRRLGFAQGGVAGFRLVFITPPIRQVTAYRIDGRLFHEATWAGKTWPFRYATAPLLVDNEGRTDFPCILALVRAANRPSWIAKFSSKFRSRTVPLPARESSEIIGTYEESLRHAEHPLAQSYEDALPYPPNLVDRQRRRTFEELIQPAERASQWGKRC